MLCKDCKKIFDRNFEDWGLDLFFRDTLLHCHHDDIALQDRIKELEEGIREHQSSIKKRGEDK